MLPSMTLEEFEKRYARNAARQALFEQLSVCVNALASDFETSTVVVHGSYVTDKEIPNDIDLLVSTTGKRDGTSPAPHLWKSSLPKDVHAKFDQYDIGPKFKPPLTARELVDRFDAHAGNVGAGIAVGEALEIIR